MTDQPAEMPVVDAEPKPEAPKQSKIAMVAAKVKAGVSLLIRKISEYPGTALLAAVIAVALAVVFL